MPNPSNERIPTMNPATVTANQIIQVLGNGLSVHTTTSVGKPKFTLEQKLKLFNSVHHSGEIMVVKPIGAEIIK
jgi:hypothetical protein